MTAPSPANTRKPAGNVAGWLGAEHVREHRQPLAHWGGLVVDDQGPVRTLEEDEITAGA
jgi:hypothetical protein